MILIFVRTLTKTVPIFLGGGLNVSSPVMRKHETMKKEKNLYLLSSLYK